MYKKNDPNSFTVYHSLYDGKTTPIGYLIADYHVTKYDNVQVQNTTSVNKSNERNFLLHCTQRIVISNQLAISPSKTINSYPDYPTLIITSLNLNRSPINGKVDNDGLNIEVINYSPHTVNTKIQKSGSTGDSKGNTLGTSKSSSVGSTSSETNSYGATVSVGLTELSDSASFNYDHSSTFSHDQSSTRGTDSSTNRSQDSSNSDSMSVKDWGAYGMVDPTSQSPNWIFGQEYPWDAIECTQTNGSQNPANSNQEELKIPNEMLARLYDGTCVYPPSQLSVFGVNFVMKNLWLVNLDNDIPDDITIQHNISYSTGSHMLDAKNNIQVYMDLSGANLLRKNSKDSYESITTSLNLPLMALSVLGLPNKPAIIGFLPRKFIVNPSENPFKIISASNTLLIEDTTDYGKGNSYPVASPFFSTSETALTASLATSPPNPLSTTAYFKVVDTVNDYKLYLKHWKMGAIGIKLTITINGDTDNSIIKYVDSSEAEGGENNLLTIALRDQNYSSLDYHDYLQLGLNSIQLTIEPIGEKYASDCGYQIRAMSIEKV